MRPEGSKRGKPVSWAVLLAVLLGPLLGAAALLGLVSADWHDARAAVVNLDEGSRVDGKFVPMGRQLAAEILAQRTAGIEWILADEPSGVDGLRSGEYVVVVTIPADFSRRVLSFSENDADRAQLARIDVATSSNAPTRDSAQARAMARSAKEAVNQALTAQYLSQVYVNLTDAGEDFSKVVSGAEQLDSGASKLADGTKSAADSSTKLADGLEQLDSAGRELLAGSQQLTGGGEQLASAAGELSSGAQSFDSGVREFAAQAPQLAQGIAQFDQGARRLLPGVVEYTSAVPGLIDGVSQLRDGLAQLSSGLAESEQAETQLKQLAAGASQLASGADQLAGGLEGLVGEVESFEQLLGDDQLAEMMAGLTRLGQLGNRLVGISDELAGYADGSRALPEEVRQLSAELKRGYRCPVPDEQECEQLRQAYEQGVEAATESAFRLAAERAYLLLNSTDPNTGKTYLELARELSNPQRLERLTGALNKAKELLPGLRRLRDGARELAEGSAQLSAGVEQLATELPQQLQQLTTGVDRLRDGAGEIVERARPLVDGGKQLASGARELLAGSNELSRRAGELPAGAQQLSTASGQLAEGAGKLATGTGEFAAGLRSYAEGSGRYVSGVGQASQGAGVLAGGLGQLSSGVDELGGGLGQFASELGAQSAKMPGYSQQQGEHLAEVVASPVAAEEQGATRAPELALALASVLWLGALAAISVIRAVPSNVVISQAASWRLWLSTVSLPTVVVAVSGGLLGWLGSWQLGLSGGKTAGLVGLLIFLGVLFVLTHHALIGWLGYYGSGLSLLMLAVTVALGLSSGAPGWLSALSTVSALQGGFVTVRSWLSGDEVLAGLVALGLGGVALAVASWAAIALRRQLSAKQFLASADPIG